MANDVKSTESTEKNKILLLFSSFTQQSFFALLLQAIVSEMAKRDYDIIVKMPPPYVTETEDIDSRELLEKDFTKRILKQIATQKTGRFIISNLTVKAFGFSN